MKTKKHVSLDYAIVSILANLPDSVKTISTEKPLLHSAFYKLRNDKFSMLKGVPFETTYFPYSEFVEQAFDNIEMSGLISKANPVLQKFTLDREALTCFYESEIKASLNDNQLREVKKMADQLPALVALTA